MDVLFAHTSVHCMLAWCFKAKRVQPLGTGVTDGCKPPGGHWELIPGPLKEQQVFLTPAPAHFLKGL